MTHYQETHAHEAPHHQPAHVETVETHHTDTVEHGGGYSFASYSSVMGMVIVMVFVMLLVLFLIWAA